MRTIHAPVFRTGQVTNADLRGLEGVRDLYVAGGFRPLQGDAVRPVVANGCFDLPHLGHLHLLRAAKGMGDRLIVAVNADADVRALKGPGRPVVPLPQRLMLLDAWQLADAFVVFGGDKQLAYLLQQLRPVLVKGLGSPPTPGEEHASVLAYVRLVPSWSTTGLIDACALSAAARAAGETKDPT